MVYHEDLLRAAEVLRNASHVVVFTGAGISAESGIPTFRDDDGFWQRFPAEQFATWEGIVRTSLRKPRTLAEFAYEVIHPIATAQPNAGHKAIEELERHLKVTVVTQNIDGLHQVAGNTIVREIHGSMFETVSLKGRFRNLISRHQLASISKKLERICRGWFALPRLLLAIRPWLGLGLAGIHRPNLVLFGDAMAEPAWSLATEAVRECDCFLQIGCSGVVLPAAMLPMEAKAVGASVIAVDPQPTDGDYWLQGEAGTVLPQLIEAAFGGAPN